MSNLYYFGFIWMLLFSHMRSHSKENDWITTSFYFFFSSSKHFSYDFPQNKIITAGKIDNRSFFWQKWTLTMQKMTIRQGICSSPPLIYGIQHIKIIFVNTTPNPTEWKNEQTSGNQFRLVTMCAHTVCLHVTYSFVVSALKILKTSQAYKSATLNKTTHSIHSFQLKKGDFHPIPLKKLK